MEAVNTFELGVVPFISRHFVLPTDVDTFRTLLPGEDHPLEAGSISFRPSRPEEQEVSTFKTSQPEEGHPLRAQEVIKSSCHQGHLSSSLGRDLSLEHWRTAKVHTTLSQGYSGRKPQPSV